jgi:hypothetical protein
VKSFERLIIVLLMVAIIFTAIIILLSSHKKDYEGNYLVINNNGSTDEVTNYMKAYLPEHNYFIVNSSNSYAKSIIKEHGLLMLPVVFINFSVEDTPAFNNTNFSSRLVKGESGYIITDWANNYIDDNSRIIDLFKTYELNMRILAIKPWEVNVKPQVDYFIRSQDPDDNDLESTMYDLYKTLNITVYPRYIIRTDIGSCIMNQSYCSTLGAQELYQDVRELCAYYYQGIDEYYELVITNNRVNKTENNPDINKCFLEEQVPILNDEKKVSMGGLNITETTIFINGVPYNGTKDYNSLKERICKEYLIKPETC